MLPVFELTIAVILDLAIGDPAWLYRLHPKRLLVMLTDFLEGLLREKMGFELKTAGVLLTLLVIAAACLAATLLSGTFWWVRVILMYWVLSARRLTDDAREVQNALMRHDLSLARSRLSLLVRYDTDRMTERDVVRAAVEYVSLNAHDWMVGPLMYMALGSFFGWGAAIGWIYLAINTLDATIGYRNERYVDIGRFAARLDDAVNLIPARITGWLMIAAAGILRLDAPGALRAMERDHGSQASPNGGWAMAATAGALGVHLGGDVRIGGVVMHRRMVGEGNHLPEPEDIRRTRHLVWCVYGMVFLLAALLLLLL